MSIVVRMIVAITLAMPLVSLVVAAAPSECPNARKTPFAVVAEAPTSPNPSTDWLARGVAFDLEKRLGRLPSLDAADRLGVANAVGSAKADEATRAASVIERTGAIFVLYVKASAEGERVSLAVDLWTRERRAASLASAGMRVDLFALVDGLVDEIVPELAKAGVDAGKPDGVPGLKWHPSRSVAAYEDLISGMLLLQKGDALQARARLLKALAAEQDNWFACYFLGAAALHQGDIAKAADYCRTAISVNPDVYAGVYANLSYCRAAMGDDKQAEWAKTEFERRTGKALPARTVPGGMPMGSFGVSR